MVVLPERVAHAPFVRGGQSLADYLSEMGWVQRHRGKVRDIYIHSDHEGQLLFVATDRLSIFDIVLPALVEGKGEILTALTHFWLTQMVSTPHHLVGVPADKRLPRERCLLVYEREVQPFELIFRHHIGGSVWEEYQKYGTAAGVPLPPGLKQWQRLDQPIFTPSTKAEEGHDVNIPAATYYAATGEMGRETVETLRALYINAYKFAEARGVLILDTKFEANSAGGLVDEVMTMDSSRMVLRSNFDLAMVADVDPDFHDKELVRQWGRTVPTPFSQVGLQGLEPANPAHLAFVANLEIPEAILAMTTGRYHEIFQLLVGTTVTDYLQNVMGIS